MERRSSRISQGNGTRILTDLIGERDADSRGSHRKNGTRILAALTGKTGRGFSRISLENGTRILADLTGKRDADVIACDGSAAVAL
jgi:hypothetical protein